MNLLDTIVVGGGQAGMSAAYFLRRNKLDYLVLDDRERAGGAWLQTWDSLKLFSPTEYSSLSGWMMPKGEHEYPSKNEFIDYLEAYEKRYAFPIKRKTKVFRILEEEDIFKVETNRGDFYAKTIISATGSSQEPFVPTYPNHELYQGAQFHSINYKNTNDLIGKKVLIVGGGNSGAQILAEVSKVTQTQWVTLKPPSFLPDEVDGRYLFNEATKKFLAKKNGKPATTTNLSLGNIVVVESVREARERNVLNAKPPFKAFYENGVVWQDGTKEFFDVVIWCTGFKANLNHLNSLDIIRDGRIKTRYTRSVENPAVWLIGYGNWTGFASATIYGVGKTARQTVKEIVLYLDK